MAGYYYLDEGGTPFSPAEESGIQIGDILLKVNGINLRDVDRAADIIKRESSKGDLNFLFNRKGDILQATVTPFLSSKDQEYRIGVYIRDTAAGVETYLHEPQSNFYAPSDTDH